MTDTTAVKTASEGNGCELRNHTYDRKLRENLVRLFATAASLKEASAADSGNACRMVKAQRDRDNPQRNPSGTTIPVGDVQRL